MSFGVLPFWRWLEANRGDLRCPQYLTSVDEDVFNFDQETCVPAVVEKHHLACWSQIGKAIATSAKGEFGCSVNDNDWFYLPQQGFIGIRMIVHAEHIISTLWGSRWNWDKFPAADIHVTWFVDIELPGSHWYLQESDKAFVERVCLVLSPILQILACSEKRGSCRCRREPKKWPRDYTYSPMLLTLTLLTYRTPRVVWKTVHLICWSSSVNRRFK